jgi:hypothetical protein
MNRHSTSRIKVPAKKRLGDELRKMGVSIPQPREISAYRAAHPDLAPLLPKIARALRKAFGPSLPISLELYKDPEIDDRYLSFFVRPVGSVSAFIDELDEISRRFDPALAKVSGHFLLMPDLRKNSIRNGL